MVWVLRGLRDGIVTTRYPRRPDGYGNGFRAAVVTRQAVRAADAPQAADARQAGGGLPDGDGGRGTALEQTAARCPTAAISIDRAADRPALATAEDARAVVRVDRARCIGCGRCVTELPDRFAFDPAVEVAALDRRALVVPAGDEDDGDLDRLRGALHRRVGALRRSIHVRHVDAGSDGSEEWEVAALTNPVYDVQRLGIFFTATPRHADVLLVTGTGTAGMTGALRRTYEAMPEPRVVVAAGTDAASGGLVHPTYAAGPGIGALVPVDVWVPGSPPSPFSILHGILLGIGLLLPGGNAS